jgi:hypothetical protein
MSTPKHWEPWKPTILSGGYSDNILAWVFGRWILGQLMDGYFTDPRTMV